MPVPSNLPRPYGGFVSPTQAPKINPAIGFGATLGAASVIGLVNAITDGIGQAGANNWRDNLIAQFNNFDQQFRQGFRQEFPVSNGTQYGGKLTEVQFRPVGVLSDGTIMRGQLLSFEQGLATAARDVISFNFGIRNGRWTTYFITTRGEQIDRSAFSGLFQGGTEVYPTFYLEDVVIKSDGATTSEPNTETKPDGEPKKTGFHFPFLNITNIFNFAPTPTPTRSPERTPTSTPTPTPTPQPTPNPNGRPTPQPTPQPNSNPTPTPNREGDNRRAPLLPPQPTPTPTDPNAPPKPDASADNKLTWIVGALGTLLAAVLLLPKINDIRQASKQGTCDAFQPNECGDTAIKRSTEPISNKVSAVSSTVGAILGLVQALTNGFSRLYTALGVDRALNILTTATVLHNALMLSKDIGETLGSTVDNVVNVLGFKWKNEDGDSVEFSELIGQNATAAIISIVGAERYAELTLSWQKASAIFSTGANILNTTQSLLDPLSSAIEYGMENVSKIGNGLKEDGVVSENAYPHMSETVRARSVNRFERLGDTLEGAENVASSLEQTTGSIVSARDDLRQLREDKAAFDLTVEQLKTQNDEQLAEIKEKLKPVADVDLVKADDDDD